jgi:hypothetical protein
MRNADIIKALLGGAYIAKRANRRSGFNYALYKDNGIIVCAISDVVFSIYQRQFKEKKGQYTFNLNLVRQQHGNSLTKQLYKEFKQK